MLGSPWNKRRKFLRFTVLSDHSDNGGKNTYSLKVVRSLKAAATSQKNGAMTRSEAPASRTQRKYETASLGFFGERSQRTTPTSATTRRTKRRGFTSFLGD